MRRVLLNGIFLLTLVFLGVIVQWGRSRAANNEQDGPSDQKDLAAANAVQLVKQGRQIFRFDTFGDQAFWGIHLSFTRRLKELA